MSVITFQGKVLTEDGKVAADTSCCCDKCGDCSVPPTMYAHIKNLCGKWSFPIYKDSSGSGVCWPRWTGSTDQVICRSDAYNPCGGSPGTYTFSILFCYGTPCTATISCAENFTTVTATFSDCDDLDIGDQSFGPLGTCGLCQINPSESMVWRITDDPIDPWP